MNWYAQHLSCCQLISALNAARYFGLPTPGRISDEFEQLVNWADCRKGPATNMNAVATSLGLYRRLIHLDFATVVKHLPVSLIATVGECHEFLAVDCQGTELKVINYHGSDDVDRLESWISWRLLDFSEKNCALAIAYERLV